MERRTAINQPRSCWTNEQAEEPLMPCQHKSDIPGSENFADGVSQSQVFLSFPAYHSMLKARPVQIGASKNRKARTLSAKKKDGFTPS